MVLADPIARQAPPASSLRRAPARGGLGEGGRSALRLALFAAGMLVAFAGLHVALEGLWWWLMCAAIVVLLVLAIGIARALSSRHWLPGAVGVGAGIVVLTLGFAREQSLLGVLPTPDVVGRWVELVNLGSRSIAGQRMPATADEGILFLLAVLAVVSVVGIAPLLDRVPAVGALPILVVLDIPVALRAGVAEPVWFVLAALAYLALLRVGRRRAPLGGILVVTVVAIVGSLVLPPVFPPARPPVRDGGTGLGTGLNPLINLGEDLRREVVVDALSYETDAPGGLYLRLATLDRFTGLTWEPDSAGIDLDYDVAEFPTAPGLEPEVPRTPYTADIRIADVSGRWLPVPYPAVSIEGLEGSWNWEPDGLAVRSNGAPLAGQQYAVDFLDVAPNREQLLADLEPDVASRFLALPDGVPDIVAATAASVAGAGTAYDQAIALQELFTGPGSDFEYSLDTPVSGDFDGTGVSAVAEFLEVRSGYCVHYASAMAVLARVLEIPSRVVVGFQPGERNAAGDGYVVSSDDLHAWPELYFEGIGWLRFEPTPGRGAPPAYSSIDAVDDPDTPEIEGVNPSAAPVPPPTTAPSLPPEEEETPDEKPEVRAADPTPVVVAVTLGILALLLSPAAARAFVRQRRLRRVRDGDAEAAWAEIRDTAHDHDWVAPDTETPRQLGARLAAVVGDGPVVPLTGGVESAAYAPPGRSVLTVDDVEALRRAIAGSAALKVRLAAFFAPPSLVARFGLGRRSDE